MMRIKRWTQTLGRAGLLAGLALLIAAGALPAHAAGTAEKRLALVVGNARYSLAPLNNPENDARVVASTLRRLGFEVTEHVNLPVRDFRRVLREYARRVQNHEGTAVFFYAGHGVQIEGRNYLLPVDIDARDESEVKDEAVDIDDLLVSRLEHARAQVRIVILDACRDNPFSRRTRGSRSVGAGLVEMGARGALIAYSSGPGATAEDGPPGTNSAFTRHLVKEMLVEGMEVEQMFKSVRVKVLRDTNQRQIPWVNSSLISNFSFNPGLPGDAAEAARREDLARLQATLERREREQRELEDKVRRLSRQLEQVQAAGPPTAAPPLAVAAPAQVAAAPQLPLKVASPAPEKVAQASANNRLPGRKGEPGAASERCVALLIRAQLGEPLTSAELSHLQKECR